MSITVFVGTRAEMDDWCRENLGCSGTRAEVDRRVLWVGGMPDPLRNLRGRQFEERPTLVETGSVRLPAVVVDELLATIASGVGP